MSFNVARILVVLSLAGAGCSGSSSGASLGQDPSTALPPIKVDLPPQPSFAPPDVAKKYPDGAYSIYGARKEKATTLGKDVKIRGYLVAIYQCPVCPKGQNCKACDQPHFFLGDKPDTPKEKAMLVVDYLAPKQKPPVLTVGKQYDVEGTFSINSPTGFAHHLGLLIFNKMKDDKGQEFLSAALALQQKAAAGEGKAPPAPEAKLPPKKK